MSIFGIKLNLRCSRYPLHLDNSVAGGIPSGLSPSESIIKESHEEASLPEEFTRTHIRPAGCISYFHATAKGWLQPEVQYLYDLRIPESESESGKVVLRPLDGEVESFEVSVHGEALSLSLVLVLI